MIKVKHPDEQCNIAQEAMIAKCPANNQEYQALMFSHGNASYLYHSNAKNFKPTVEDFMDWLSGLEPGVKKGMEELGFDGCLGVYSFTRYINEKNDIGMDQYIKQLMGEQDFTNYMNKVANIKSQ